MSDILDKAKDLAEAISSSEELEALRNAEIQMGNDKEAVAIVQEFQTTQRALYEKQANGAELTDEEKAKVEDIEGRMEKNANIQAYLDAQAKVENLLRSVNFIIGQALTGNNDGGGCSSCGGGDCGTDSSCGCDGSCN